MLHSSCGTMGTVVPADCSTIEISPGLILASIGPASASEIPIRAARFPANLCTPSGATAQIGCAPGTLTQVRRSPSWSRCMTLRTYLYDASGKDREIALSQVDFAALGNKNLLWIDLEGPGGDKAADVAGASAI